MISQRDGAILHIGDIAGVPQELSRAQRKIIGFKSDVLSFEPNPFRYNRFILPINYCII